MPVARLGVVIESDGAVRGAKLISSGIDGISSSAKRAEANLAQAFAALKRQDAAADFAKVAQASDTVARSTARQASAVLETALASGSATVTAKQLSAAWAAEAAVATTATTATTALGGAVSLLGGPAGVAALLAMQGLELVIGEVTKRAEKAAAATKAQAKAIDEATEAARRYQDAEANGFAASTVRNLEAKRREIAQITAEIEKGERANRLAQGGAIGSGTGVVGKSDTSPLVAARTQAIEDLRALERQFNELQLEAEKNAEDAKTRQRVILLKGDRAIAEDRAAALQKLQFDVARLKVLQDEAAGGADNVAERSKLVEEIKALNDALNPSTTKDAAAATKLFNEQLDRSVERFKSAADNRTTLNKAFRDGQKAVQEAAEAEKVLKVVQELNGDARTRELSDLEKKEKRLNEVKAAQRALRDLEGQGYSLSDIGNANVVKEAEDFVATLQQAVSVVQLLADAFGDVGREVGRAAGGAQSIVSGILAARELKAADGKRPIGLGTALSGSEGIGAFASGVSVVQQYAAGALALAEAFGLFDDAAKRAREGQRAYTKALEEYAIVQRSAIEDALRADIARANQAGQAAFAASGATGTLSFSTAKELEETIAQLKSGPKEFQPFRIELEKLLVTVKANEEKIRAEVAARVVAANEDLAVRRLLAAGRTEEADALRLQLAQQRELTDARNQFKDADGFADFIKNLEDVQKAEAEAAEAARELAAAEKLLQQARQAQAFGADLRARGQALSGDDRGAAITRLGISQAGELQAAEALLKAGTITQEMFDELARVLGGELAKAIEDLDKAAQDAAKAIEQEKQNKREELAVRALVAAGDETGAARMRREIANRQELEGVTDEALRAEILRVQGLEALAIALAEAARLEQERAAQNDDINRRLIDAYRVLDPVKAAELEQIREQIEREELLRGAVDDATRARYEELFAIEDQAKAVKKLADEQRAAAEAAEKLANLTATVEEEYLRATGRGFDADRKALERRRDEKLEEARKAGASEETIRQIKAIFEASLQTLIARTIEASTPAGGGGKTGTQSAEMVFQQQSVSRSISGLEAIRLIDVGLSQLAVLRQIAANTSVRGLALPEPPRETRSPETSFQSDDALLERIDNAMGRRIGVGRRLAGKTSLY